jgi:hypothetical protein
MTLKDLQHKLRVLIKQVYSNQTITSEEAVQYDELTKFPELKAVLVDLDLWVCGQNCVCHFLAGRLWIGRKLLKNCLRHIEFWGRIFLCHDDDLSLQNWERKNFLVEIKQQQRLAVAEP